MKETIVQRFYAMGVFKRRDEAEKNDKSMVVRRVIYLLVESGSVWANKSSSQ